MAPIDQLSLCSLYIEPWFIDGYGAEQKLGNATGFIYKRNNKSYLVSNWHVLSGRCANAEGQPVHKMCALPEFLKVFFPVSGKIGETLERKIYLKKDGEFVWLQHPRGSDIDVAAIPVEDMPMNCIIFPINEINESRGLSEPPLGEIYLGREIFILGFPLGIKGSGKLPIWKRGSIATEPSMPIEDNAYKVLVDTATRPGMSGSPVIIVSYPGAQATPDGMEQLLNIRSYKLFLGIYSGRISDNDDMLAAQLGIFWKEKAIREIIDGKIFYREAWKRP